MNPAIVFMFICLVRKASHHKKKDLCRLAKHVSPAMLEELAAANPPYREAFRSGSLDYSWTDWVKDELFGVFPRNGAVRP